MKSSSWHPSSRKAKTYSSCVCVCCRVGVSAFQKQTRPQMGKFFGGNGCIYYLVLGIKGICICPNSSIYTHLIHVPSKRTSVKLRNAEPIHRQMRVPVWTHCSVCQSGGFFFLPTLFLKCRKPQWAAWWSRNTVGGSLVAPGVLPSPVASLSQCREWKSTLSFRFLLIRINFAVGYYGNYLISRCWDGYKIILSSMVWIEWVTDMKGMNNWNHERSV